MTEVQKVVEHMMPQIHSGIVQEIGASKAGNRKIRVDGEWYQSGNKVDLSSIVPGMSISFEYHTYPFQNHVYRSIDNWGLNSTTTVSPPVMAVPIQTSPVPAVTVTATPKLSKVNIPIADGEARMRFVSGVTQSAIQAGLAKTPYEAQKWFNRACDIIDGKEVEEEIPF